MFKQQTLLNCGLVDNALGTNVWKQEILFNLFLSKNINIMAWLLSTIKMTPR